MAQAISAQTIKTTLRRAHPPSAENAFDVRNDFRTQRSEQKAAHGRCSVAKDGRGIRSDFNLTVPTCPVGLPILAAHGS